MILDKIVEDKKIRLQEIKKQIPLEKIRYQAENSIDRIPNYFYQALKRPGLSIIGEFKMASPSLGNITSRISLEERMAEYNDSVDAVSCLTEEDHFHGSIDYFAKIRHLTELPVLRKDFMIDEYQFYEAKAIGADAVLLITAILDDSQMKNFYQLARELQMDVLVETHNETEMERTLKLNPRIVGINNRDLKDFTIHLETTERLRRMVPEGKVIVSESGVTSDDDISYLRDCNVDALLIGRAFMEAKDPKSLANRWRGIYD